MTVSAQTFPKAFAVWFHELDRWDPSSFHDIAWHWPRHIMQPIGSVLKPRKEKVDRNVHEFSDLQPITIHFDGSVDKRKVDVNREYTMDLCFARPGDIVVAKIDLKNGAVCIVPNEWDNAVVTGHFAVYEPNRSRLVPEYLLLVIQTSFYKAHLWRNKVGAEGRKEVKLNFFEAERIPLPPIPVQQSVVDRWKQAQAEIAAAFTQAEQQEKGIAKHIYKALGVPKPVENGPPPKYMALQWKDLERWSYNFLVRSRQGLLGFHKSSFPIVPLSDCLEETTNGYCIKPVAGPTPHKMLKLNALAPSGLDLTKSKYISVPDRIAERFSLRKGDLLICRSVGSYDHVAKCALVEEDKPDTLFPDIIIRARFKPTVLPQYVREVMLTPLGRSHFLSNARTAVGMWKIGAEDIRNFPLPLPPLDVQKEIVRQIAEKRDEIARTREAAERKARESKAEIEAMILGKEM